MTTVADQIGIERAKWLSTHKEPHCIILPPSEWYRFRHEVTLPVYDMHTFMGMTILVDPEAAVMRLGTRKDAADALESRRAVTVLPPANPAKPEPAPLA